jgi:hypothetical protein
MLDIDTEHNHETSQLILLLSADVKALKVKNFNHAEVLQVELGKCCPKLNHPTPFNLVLSIENSIPAPVQHIEFNSRFHSPVSPLVGTLEC